MSCLKDKTDEQLLQEMQEKLQNILPPFEIKYKAELVSKIRQIKKKKNALILGHNYMEPALFHFVPDFQGDSLQLCRQAAQTQAPILVFCGVKFMAETAKILNPNKKVLIPSLEAGCSLAASITAEDVRRLKKRFPGVPVVTYINTYADVKAESDICCTSSNAKAVIEHLNSDTVIFIPDEYLSKNVARETGKHIIVPTKDLSKLNDNDVDYQIIGWPGRCEVHEKFSVQDIENVRKQFHNDVTVLAHPECSPEVVAASDFSGSTSAMIQFVKNTSAKRYLLLTECSMGDNIAAEAPEKEMVRLCSVRCPHMNQITLEQTLASLQNEIHEIKLEENIRKRAEQAVRKMLEIH
ncbi:MAG: quinolinate synthase NadA [Planctomycetota bacterium]|nr:MAG: quinolinate synthase NadA [Planctomycetota bacterium]